MTSSDEVMGIFEDLDPDRFHFGGSAVIDEPEPGCGFVEFIDRNLVMLRAQFAAAGGAPNPVVFLSSATRVCGFVAWDGETIEGFVDRLVAEAARMGAVRVFFYRRTQVAALPLGSPMGRAAEGSAIDAVDPEDAGLLHDGIVWYAEEVDGRERVRLSGIFEVSGPERVIDTGLRSGQPISALDPILGQFLPAEG